MSSISLAIFASKPPTSPDCFSQGRLTDSWIVLLLKDYKVVSKSPSEICSLSLLCKIPLSQTKDHNTVWMCPVLICFLGRPTAVLQCNRSKTKDAAEGRIGQEPYYLSNKEWEMEVKTPKTRSVAHRPHWLLSSDVYNILTPHKTHTKNQNSFALCTVSYFLHHSVAHADPAATAISRVHFPWVGWSHSIVSQPWGKHPGDKSRVWKKRKTHSGVFIIS